MQIDNLTYIGKQLRRDLFNDKGVLIVPARTILDNHQLRLTELHGIALADEDVQQVQGSPAYQDAVDDGVDLMRDILEHIRYAKQIPLLEIRNQVVPLIHRLTNRPDFFQLFASLQSKEDYLYRHSLAVGILSTLIGRWLNMKGSVLAQLTIAATLHDIGKARIPLDLLEKPGKLTDEEFEWMKKHTLFGYEMMKATAGINRGQALVALQHHERQDGSGYPLGIAGDAITSFSRIVAVADMFHAMTSERVYRTASPWYDALRQMDDHTFGQLDPRVSRRFMDRIMQAMIGNRVLLSDNRTGIIRLILPHDPLRPLVGVDDGFVDLRTHPNLHIMQVLPG